MIRRLWLCLWLLTASCTLLAPPAFAMLNEVTAANRYVGNDSTTVFAYTFRALLKTDLEVLVDGVVKTVDTHYTVSGLGASGGGSVTFLSPPASSSAVTILRKQPVAQGSDYVPNEAFPAERLEKDLDKQAMISQQHKEALDRAIKLPKKSTLSGIDFPEPGADKYIKWNAAGTALEAALAGGGGGGGGGLPSDPTACASGQYVTDQNEVGTLTCAQVGFSQVSGAVTDAQVPNTITVDQATTATALAANGTNCTSGEASQGVDASGNAEGCFAPSVTNHNVLSATHPDSLAASPVLGDLFHGNATPAWARLAGNTTTTKKFLNQTGTGSVSAVPSWDALTDADIPDSITISQAQTATALATNPDDCVTNMFASGINTYGDLSCTQPSFGDLSGFATDGQIPDTITLTNITQITNRAIGDTTGLLGLSRGGLNTDLSGGAATGDILYANSSTTFARLAAGTNGYVLTLSGGLPAWSSPGAPAGHNILSASHSDTVAASVVLGDLMYGNATPAWQRLAGNTTTAKKFLVQTGTGSVSAAPVWGYLEATDFPSEYIDSFADFSDALCNNGQTFLKVSGTWDCGTASGVTSLGGQTGSTQTFATATTGTDFTISSASNVHTFAIPSASASARGLVTTGAQTFGGIKTIPGVVVNGTPAIGLDLTSGTYSTMAIKDQPGTSVYFADSWASKGWELARGTAGTPYTSGGPSLKISRTQDISKATCNSIDLNGECSATVVVNVKSTATGQSQSPIALHARTETKSLSGSGYAGPEDGDAVTVIAIGEATAGNRYGQGGYFEGGRFTTGTRAMGLTAQVSNRSTADCNGFSVADGIPPHCVALEVVSYSPGGWDTDSGIQLHSLNNSLFRVGLSFSNNTIRETSIWDASAATTSYLIDGSHNVGIYMSGAITTGLSFASSVTTPIQVANFAGGGNRAVCTSNSGSFYRGADGTCGGVGGATWLNVMTDYGAVCNGSTNDATAINNALTAANAAGGGTVYIPDGKVCAISASLTMSGSNVTLMSHGTATLKKTANIQAINVTGTDNTVMGLRINGNSSGGSGVYVYGSRNTVKDLWVHNNTAHGIGLDGQSTTCANNLVTNNRVVNNGGIGIAINKCTHNRIIGNRASSNSLEGITVDNLANYTVVANNEVDGNAISGGVGGIGLDYVTYVTISGNVIKNNVTNVPGIRTQNNLGISSNISIVGNTLYNNPWGCIDLQTGTGNKYTHYTTVTGNSCSANGTALKVGVGGTANALIGNTLNGGSIVDNGTSTRNVGN